MASVEPFMVHRIEVPFGAIELMRHVPVLASSPHVAVPQSDPQAADQTTTHRAGMLLPPSPRIYIGFQGNLDALWH